MDLESRLEHLGYRVWGFGPTDSSFRVETGNRISGFIVETGNRVSGVRDGTCRGGRFRLERLVLPPPPPPHRLIPLP